MQFTIQLKFVNKVSDRLHACAVGMKEKTHKFQEIQSFMRVSASDGEKKGTKESVSIMQRSSSRDH